MLSLLILLLFFLLSLNLINFNDLCFFIVFSSSVSRKESPIKDVFLKTELWLEVGNPKLIFKYFSHLLKITNIFSWI